MVPPSPDIERENLAEDLLRHLSSVQADLSALDGVVGIVLHGGLARGYADELSEIDLLLVLEDDVYSEWLEGRAPITTGITVIDGQLYDIDVTTIADLSEEWFAVERWDRSYADILYDPTGDVRSTFTEHLDSEVGPGADDVEGHLFECWWHYRLAGDCWILREDPAQGHFVLNAAVESLLKALFAVNGEQIPHQKWLVHLSRSLKWTPSKWNRRLATVVTADLDSTDSLRQRQATIEALFDEIDAKARREFDPELPVRFMQRTFYRALERLVTEERIAIDDWDSSFGLKLLNHDPFSAFAGFDGDAVVLDRAALQSISSEEMYDWHFEILAAVAEGAD